MKLSDWAKKQGIHYNTAYNWFNSGKMPCESYKTKSGTIMVIEKDIIDKNNIAIYCRVSSHDKKDDLKRQIQRCETFCLAKGYSITSIYKEIASGMNDNRKELLKMIH
jgi:predicted site-specific integrase-resolvase